MNYDAIRPDGPTVAIEHQAIGETPVHVTPEGIRPAVQAAETDAELNLKAALALLNSAKDLIAKETDKIPRAKEEQTDRQRLLIDMRYSVLFAIVELKGYLNETEAKA